MTRIFSARLFSILVLTVLAIFLTVTPARATSIQKAGKPLSVPSTKNSDAKKLLQQAEKSIRAGNFDKALSPLELLARKHWKSSQSQKAIPLLIDAMIRKGRTKEAEEWSERYLKHHPASPYLDRVWISKATILAKKGFFFESAQLLFRTMRFSNNRYLYHRARLNMLHLLEKDLLTRFEMLTLLQDDPVDDKVVGHLLYCVAAENAKAGKKRSAKFFINRLLGELPGHDLTEKAQKLRTQLETMPTGNPSVLIVAPLTGNLSGIGKDAIQGALLALESFAVQGKQLNYSIVDSEKDPAATVQKVAQRFREDSVVAIIGPVMSSTAVALASWLSVAHPDIPMITPTATDEGIANLGSNIFQFNIPTRELARSMAEYSLSCLKLSEFAILAPNTDYGHIMAEEFSRTVKAQGGQINALEFYREGEEDYEKHFMKIRVHQYNLMMERRYLNWGKKGEVKIQIKERTEFFEEKDTELPALFIAAADPAEAAKLATQTNFYKIKTQLLGSSGWYGRPVLRKGRKYVEGSRFNTPFLEKSSDSVWISFRKDYSRKWSSYPGRDKVAGLSYDAMRFFLKAWNARENDKASLAELKKIRIMNGTYGTLEFDPNTGANRRVHTIEIRDRKFHFAKKCSEETLVKRP